MNRINGSVGSSMWARTWQRDACRYSARLDYIYRSGEAHAQQDIRPSSNEIHTCRIERALYRCHRQDEVLSIQGPVNPPKDAINPTLGAQSIRRAVNGYEGAVTAFIVGYTNSDGDAAMAMALFSAHTGTPTSLCVGLSDPPVIISYLATKRLLLSRAARKWGP